MTASSQPVARELGTARPAARPTYAHAHWYFLAALAAIVAGFWPSFFRPLGAGTAAHTVHGIAATGWVLMLVTQSFLMSRGLVAWHRRVARVAWVLVPVFCLSGLYMVGVMFSNEQMPPFLPPLLAFIDIPSIAFFLVLFGLAIANRRTPAAHKRYMSATVLLGFPPALTRLYLWALGLDFMVALHASLVTAELVLVALIAADWRSGERGRRAYPMSLAFFAVVHALMLPVSASGVWQAFMSWYAHAVAG